MGTEIYKDMEQMCGACAKAHVARIGVFKEYWNANGVRG